MIIRPLTIKVGVDRIPAPNLSEVLSYSAPVAMIRWTISLVAGSVKALSRP